MAQRTQATLQAQWNIIEKELKEITAKALPLTLKQYSLEALRDINNASSYTARTGNLDASLMAGVYHKGTLIHTTQLNPSNPAPYIVKSDAEVDTGYGDTITVSKGDLLSGKTESLKALSNYSNQTSGGYERPYEMIIVAEMFYRYFIENPWMHGFIDFEQRSDLEARVEGHFIREMQRQGRNAKGFTIR